MSYGRALIRAVRHDTDWTKHVAYRPVKSLGSTESIDQLLAKPTWSVRTLLPRHTQKRETATSEHGDGPTNPNVAVDDEITPSKLHHLLRLSALPLPKDQAEESRLLKDLRSQVHFVRHLQSLDTTDVEPLVAIRDETIEAKKENEITLKDLKPWLDLEKHVGRNGTVRRPKTSAAALQQNKSSAGQTSGDSVGKDGVAPDDPRIFKVQDLPPSGNEEGRRWGKFYVVRRGEKKATAQTTTTTADQPNDANSTIDQDRLHLSHHASEANQPGALLSPAPEDHLNNPTKPPKQLNARQQQIRAARDAADRRLKGTQESQQQMAGTDPDAEIDSRNSKWFSSILPDGPLKQRRQKVAGKGLRSS